MKELVSATARVPTLRDIVPAPRGRPDVTAGVERAAVRFDASRAICPSMSESSCDALPPAPVVDTRLLSGPSLLAHRRVASALASPSRRFRSRISSTSLDRAFAIAATRASARAPKAAPTPRRSPQSSSPRLRSFTAISSASISDVGSSGSSARAAVRSLRSVRQRTGEEGLRGAVGPSCVASEIRMQRCGARARGMNFPCVDVMESACYGSSPSRKRENSSGVMALPTASAGTGVKRSATARSYRAAGVSSTSLLCGGNRRRAHAFRGGTSKLSSTNTAQQGNEEASHDSNQRRGIQVTCIHLGIYFCCRISTGRRKLGGRGGGVPHLVECLRNYS